MTREPVSYREAHDAMLDEWDRRGDAGRPDAREHAGYLARVILRDALRDAGEVRVPRLWLAEAADIFHRTRGSWDEFDREFEARLSRETGR